MSISRGPQLIILPSLVYSDLPNRCERALKSMFIKNQSSLRLWKSLFFVAACLVRICAALAQVPLQEQFKDLPAKPYDSDANVVSSEQNASLLSVQKYGKELQGIQEDSKIATQFGTWLWFSWLPDIDEHNTDTYGKAVQGYQQEPKAVNQFRTCSGSFWWSCANAYDKEAQGCLGGSKQVLKKWLECTHRRAQELSYRGIFVYQRGNLVQASRIVHYVEGAHEYEHIENLDGPLHQMLRVNDEVYTLHLGPRVCVIEQQQNKDTFPALFSANGNQVDQVYTLRRHGSERVAGIDSDVVELAPKDKYRFAYKLWTDKETHLLLRMQILDAHGKVLEQVAFSQIWMGGKPSAKDKIIAQAQAAKDLHVVRPPLPKPIDMAALGWHINSTVPGFQKLRELHRFIVSPYADTPALEVDQIVFSDGLAAVSVFVEKLTARSRREGTSSLGASHMLVKRVGNAWITLIGEVPQETLQQFLAAIEYRSLK